MHSQLKSFFSVYIIVKACLSLSVFLLLIFEPECICVTFVLIKLNLGLGSLMFSARIPKDVFYRKEFLSHMS